MPTRTDSDQHPTRPETDTRELSTTDRVLNATERLARHTRRRVVATYSWARRQDRATLAWFLGLSAVALAAAYLALRLLTAMVAGVWTWLTGGAESAPAPAGDTGGPPSWIGTLGEHELWPELGHNLATWAHQVAAPTGIPAWVLAVTWCVIGLALGCAALGGQTRSTVAWWGWLSVTCWLIWEHTPGSNPVPAGLVAAIGVVLSTAPLLTMLATAVLGVVIVLGAA